MFFHSLFLCLNQVVNQSFSLDLHLFQQDSDLGPIHVLWGCGWHFLSLPPTPTTIYLWASPSNTLPFTWWVWSRGIWLETRRASKRTVYFKHVTNISGADNQTAPPVLLLRGLDGALYSCICLGPRHGILKRLQSHPVQPAVRRLQAQARQKHYGWPKCT